MNVNKGASKDVKLGLDKKDYTFGSIKLVSDTQTGIEIDGFKIKGIEVGEYILTAVMPNGNKEAKVMVEPSVEKIDLDKLSVELFRNDNATINATFTPDNAVNKALEWKSTNEGIAKVDENGTVTGVAEGTCEIICTTKDEPKVSATLQVEVKARPYVSQVWSGPQVTGITYVNGIMIVNKTHPIPADYAPGLDPTAYQAFLNLSADAAAAGYDIQLLSGYRSYSLQSQLYTNYCNTYGQAAADTFSAKPGTSEHQTGLAMDVGWIDDAYGNTPSGQWLAANCYKYGFILRYMKGKESITGYKYEPSQDEIRQMLKNLRNLKPHPCLAIQYAGGEPTVRKDIVELVEMAKEEGFTHVQIATNGIRLAKKESLAKELKDAGLNTVYLAFDGVTPEPYINNRGRDLLPDKLQAIENCRKVGLGVVLVPTLVKGVNDHQVGEIIKFALDHGENIYGVNFQPVSFSGRTPADHVEEQRITIPDFVKIIEDETDGQVPVSSFYPPSSVEPIAEFISLLDGKDSAKVTLNCHEHCGIATYVFREKTEGPGKDKLIPINRFIDVDDLFEKLTELTEKLNEGGFGIKKRVLASATAALPKLVHTSRTPKGLDIVRILLNVFTKRSYDALGAFSKDAMLISCMHFMDPFNFDEDRVKKCVIHYATPDGRIIPFCTFNSMYREGVEEEFSTPLKKSKP